MTSASLTSIRVTGEQTVTVMRGDSPMSEQNKAVIRRLIDEVWNRRAFDAADELFAPEAFIYESGVALPGTGPAVAKDAIGALSEAFPDIRITTDDMIAAEVKVVLRLSSTASHQGV